MQALSSWTKNRGTIVRLAIIPVLVAILAAVLLTNPTAEEASDDGAAQAQQAGPTGVVETSPIAREPDEGPAPGSAMASQPRLPLAAVLAHDPFARPLPSPPSVVAGEEGTAAGDPADEVGAAAAGPDTEEALRKKRVTAVFRNSQGGLSVIIDSKPLRVGDTVQEGARISEIRPEGVLLERDPP